METWSYYTLTMKNPDLGRFDELFNILGADGWDMVASLTTVKTWVNMTGNDLVFVFKKAGSGHRPPASATAAVHGDTAY